MGRPPTRMVCPLFMASFGKFAVVVVLVGTAFLAGYKARRAEPARVRPALYYTCPMHPQYRAAGPGEAPCCGMRLEPVYEVTAAAREPSFVPITPTQQQAMGISVATVERTLHRHVLRYPGRVVPDENRVYRWNAAVDGWIRQLSPPSTGSFVHEGELLATFYAPEFLGAQQSYIFGLASWDRFQATGKER